MTLVSEARRLCGKAADDKYFVRNFDQLVTKWASHRDLLESMGCPVDNPVMRFLALQRSVTSPPIRRRQQTSIGGASTKTRKANKRVKSDPTPVGARTTTAGDDDDGSYDVFLFLTQLGQSPLLNVLRIIYEWPIPLRVTRQKLFQELLEFLRSNASLLTGDLQTDVAMLRLYQRFYRIARKKMGADDRITMLAELFKLFYPQIQRHEASVDAFVDLLKSDEDVRNDMVTFAKYAEVVDDWHPRIAAMLRPEDRERLKKHYIRLILNTLRERRSGRARARELETLRLLGQWAHRLDPPARPIVQNIVDLQLPSIIAGRLSQMEDAGIGPFVPTVQLHQLQQKIRTIRNHDALRRHLLQRIQNTRRRYRVG